MELPELAQHLLDANTYAVLGTVNPDGAPQSSVIWAKREGDEIVFSTIRGRRKTLNMERDPQVSFLIFDPTNPYRYFEARGAVTMTEAGGVELINELSQSYTGRPYHEPDPTSVRVVCRLAPSKIVVRG